MERSGFGTRTERLTRLAEIPLQKLVEVLDFYHASQYLSETIRHVPPHAQSPTPGAVQALCRHVLRHQRMGWRW